ncbi:MAG: hypothetical protein NTV80_05985, partial [Verrucomicrobia bacterium]|nr:hypothetical protein [Verrucomicrobiota bacterium]
PALGKLIPQAKGIIDTSRYEGVYAVIKAPPKSGTWQLELPFFAQLHLMQSSNTVQSRGYKVTVKLIEAK